MISHKKEPAIYGLMSAILFALLIFCVHLYFIATLPFDLYADEAQYWFWSKTPEWGYFSKPPMVAWVITATTTLCGDGHFCVKLGSPILHTLTSLVMYGIGHRMFNRKVGFWSSIVYHTLPGVTVSSYIISTDPALLFFWALSLYFLVRALKQWHIKWWILLGISAGFGLLSKYTMILFFVSASLYFLFSKQNRVYLFSFKYWLAGIIAGGLYWKNFQWNMSNGFVSYLHTKDNADLKGIQLHPDEMLEFLGAQFGVFGPIFFAALILFIALRFKALVKKDEYKMLLCFILPFIGLITTISLLSRAHANWAVPTYIAATIFVVALMSQGRCFLIKLSVLIHIIAAIGFMNFDAITSATKIELTKKTDPFRRIRGQQEFAELVKKEIDLLDPDAKILSLDRKTHSTLLYYLRDENGNPPEIVKWNGDHDYDDHFDLTTDLTKHVGEDFIFVTKPYDVSTITDRFERAQKTSLITIPIHSDYTIEYDIYYLRGFKGY